jgi:hypothetical protein
MSKKSDGGKKSQQERAQRKLVKAQLALHTAQARRAEAMTRGEHEIERARQRATRRQAKATRRVERCASVLVQAEARLLAASAPPRPERQEIRAESHSTTTSPTAENANETDQSSTRGEARALVTPAEAAADALADQSRQLAQDGLESGLTLPNGAPLPPAGGQDRSAGEPHTPWK